MVDGECEEILPVILGEITFRDFEVPPTIEFGSSQRVAIHRLGGGGRVIDTLGKEDADIDFSGTLCGTDAVERATQITALCGSGQAIALAWDTYYFRVIIKEFSADYKSNRWIPYRLSCMVCSNDVAANSSIIASTTDIVMEDVRQAVTAFPAAAPAYANVARILSQGSIPPRRSPPYLAAVSALSELDGEIAACLIVAEQEGSDADRAGFDLANPAADRLRAMVESSRTIANLTTARAYARRALARLTEGIE